MHQNSAYGMFFKIQSEMVRNKVKKKKKGRTTKLGLDVNFEPRLGNSVTLLHCSRFSILQREKKNCYGSCITIEILKITMEVEKFVFEF